MKFLCYLFCALFVFPFIGITLLIPFLNIFIFKDLLYILGEENEQK